MGAKKIMFGGFFNLGKELIYLSCTGNLLTNYFPPYRVVFKLAVLRICKKILPVSRVKRWVVFKLIFNF